jgi:hypothetical protein
MTTKRNNHEYKKLDKVLTKIQHVVLMVLLGLDLGAKGSTRLELDLAASIAVGRVWFGTDRCVFTGKSTVRQRFATDVAKSFCIYDGSRTVVPPLPQPKFNNFF